MGEPLSSRETKLLTMQSGASSKDKPSTQRMVLSMFLATCCMVAVVCISSQQEESVQVAVATKQTEDISTFRPSPLTSMLGGDAPAEVTDTKEEAKDVLPTHGWQPKAARQEDYDSESAMELIDAKPAKRVQRQPVVKKAQKESANEKRAEGIVESIAEGTKDRRSDEPAEEEKVTSFTPSPLEESELVVVEDTPTNGPEYPGSSPDLPNPAEHMLEPKKNPHNGTPPEDTPVNPPAQTSWRNKVSNHYPDYQPPAPLKKKAKKEKGKKKKKGKKKRKAPKKKEVSAEDVLAALDMEGKEEQAKINRDRLRASPEVVAPAVEEVQEIPYTVKEGKVTPAQDFIKGEAQCLASAIPTAVGEQGSDDGDGKVFQPIKKEQSVFQTHVDGQGSELAQEPPKSRPIPKPEPAVQPAQSNVITLAELPESKEDDTLDTDWATVRPAVPHDAKALTGMVMDDEDNTLGEDEAIENAREVVDHASLAQILVHAKKKTGVTSKEWSTAGFQ